MSKQLFVSVNMIVHISGNIGSMHPVNDSPIEIQRYPPSVYPHKATKDNGEAEEEGVTIEGWAGLLICQQRAL